MVYIKQETFTNFPVSTTYNPANTKNVTLHTYNFLVIWDFLRYLFKKSTWLLSGGENVTL
jgi:mRNA deadenylase 3'-5' endonuclease subunit Ccr4